MTTHGVLGESEASAPRCYLVHIDSVRRWLDDTGVALVCDERRRRVGACARESKRVQLVASELLRRYAVGDTARLTPREPAGIRWSVSHSGSLVAVVTFSGPVGVDVEKHRPLGRLPDGFFSASDLDAIRSSDDPNGWLRLWVRKEAVMKCASSGWSTPGVGDLAVSGTLVRWRDGDYHLTDFEPSPGYAAAICTTVPTGAHSVRVVDEHDLNDANWESL